MTQRGVPWVLYAATFAQGLPVLAAALYGRRLPPPRRWVAVWCLALVAGNVAQLWFRGGGTNNLWVQYIVVPLHNAIMLWTLSLWQEDPVSRLAFRVAIPLDLLALVALIPAVQSASTFNQFTWPFQALVLLAGSLYTLVTRAIREPERVTSRDWFWITLGTSLYFAFRMALPPFVELMLSTNRELTRLAYVVSAWADIVAYILIARGMVCPPSPGALWWFFVMVALALVVILTAFASALIIYQRRFLRAHRTFADNLLAAHEEERAWVAREVHDDALQRVAMLVHELDDWPPAAPTNGTSERVAALREEIEDLGVMLRRVAHRMHPALIDHAGLVPALHALAVDVNRASGVRVDVTDESHVDGASPPSTAHALLVYRIAQEALRNVVKHASVSHCNMYIAVSPASIELRVTDQGKGFVADDSARGKGLGLISMAERARLADGRLEVVSRPGGGTGVRALIPRQQQH